MKHIIDLILFQQLQKWNFRIFSIMYNVNVYRVLTEKMTWEPLNCDSFFEKIYLRLQENVLEISLKIVYKRI